LTTGLAACNGATPVSDALCSNVPVHTWQWLHGVSDESGQCSAAELADGDKLWQWSFVLAALLITGRQRANTTSSTKRTKLDIGALAKKFKGGIIRYLVPTRDDLPEAFCHPVLRS